MDQDEGDSGLLWKNTLIDSVLHFQLVGCVHVGSRTEREWLDWFGIPVVGFDDFDRSTKNLRTRQCLVHLQDDKKPRFQNEKPAGQRTKEAGDRVDTTII